MPGIPLALLLLVSGADCSWFDSEDMQLFDLVEEVNGTFYDFMNLNQASATVLRGHTVHSYRPKQ